MREGLLDTR